MPSAKMPEKFPSNEDGKMFVGGLTFNTTDEMLRQYFTQWGDLIDYIVMKDPDTKRSRGFGFVTYRDPRCVDFALEHRPHVLDNKTVEAKKALPRDSQSVPPTKPDTAGPVKRLYVSGVREDHSEDQFKDHFSKYGKIVSVDLIADKSTGKKRGFAYVTFDNCEAVDKAIATRSHMIDGKRCDVKKALSRDEMQIGKDRQERDFRSRGAGRNDGYNWGSGGGSYGNMYGGTYNGPATNWSQGASAAGAGSWNQGAQSGQYYAGYPAVSGPVIGGYSGYGGTGTQTAGGTAASTIAAAVANYAAANAGGYGPAGNYTAGAVNPSAGGIYAQSAATPGYNPPGTYTTSNWNGSTAAPPAGWGQQQQQQQPPQVATGAVPGWAASAGPTQGGGAQAAQAAANWSQSAQSWQNNVTANTWNQGPARGAPSAATNWTGPPAAAAAAAGGRR